MIRKTMCVLILGVCFLSCGGDLEQGSCDEGFFEQNDGNGNIMCVPIVDEGDAESSLQDVTN